MSASAYRHDTRVLLCGRCGGPLPAPDAGGAATCDYCEATTELVARKHELTPVDEPAISEDDRIALLREQDGKPLRPPGTLPFKLMTWHGQDDDERFDQALARWQEARGKLETGDSPKESEAELYWLTLAMANYLSSKDQHDKLRGLLETAIDLTDDRVHSQVLRCMMARQAARIGDLEAAEAWLASCEAKPRDLHMDSALRHSLAYLATRAEDWDRVLEVLGVDGSEVPTADVVDHTCAMLRANALERKGFGKEARAELERVLDETPGSPRILREIRDNVSELDLCPESIYPVYEPAMRRWKLRHGIYTAFWFAAVNYLAIDWLIGGSDDAWSIGVDSPWPALAVLILGYIPFARWRP
jgi:hypothetical protein